MNVDRVVVRKILYPKPMVEINLEFDQKDGTTKLVRDYMQIKDMQMEVHSDIITMRRKASGDVYQGSYKLFRDAARGVFSDADSVVKYIMKSNNGYSAIVQRTIPHGRTLFR